LQQALPPEERNKLNYKSIAKRFSIHQNQQFQGVTRTANIDEDDVFVLLEFNCGGETVWARCKSLKDGYAYLPYQASVMVDFVDRDSDGPIDVTLYPSRNESDLPDMRIEAILWRRDTGQSFFCSITAL
jgi:hypothetical protein